MLSLPPNLRLILIGFMKSLTTLNVQKLEWEWEFEKAVWYYINLVPENLKLATTRIKGFKNHIGNTTIFINTTFKMIIVYDPEVNYMQGNELVTRKEVYDKKRKWADKLIQALIE